MSITSAHFGELPSGEPVTLFTLTNGRGLLVKITNFGGIVTAIETPDREGISADVALGKADFAAYLAGHPSFGAVCGRVAGRITNGTFELEGQHYQLVQNNGLNHLHGGEFGFDKKLWNAEVLEDSESPKLRLTLSDPEGSNGYPGNLESEIVYSLNAKNELVIDYRFRSDRTTPLAVTNHSYFNLKGEGRGTILDHEIQIMAEDFCTCDDEMTLLDQKASVNGLANDFREPALLSDRIDGLHQQHGDGYFLPGGRVSEPRLVARVRHPRSGRVLETLTTEPYLQFYTSVQMDDGELGKNGVYGRFSGFCLEAQAYPNTVNAPELGDAILQGGEERTSTTIYRFLVE